MIDRSIPLRGAAAVILLSLATGVSTARAGDPLSSLSSRGAVQASDQLPILPSGAVRLQSTTAGAILGYVRNYPVGIYCDGIHDDTATIQAAISSGVSFDLPPGVCLTNATLTIASRASHGQTIRGAGATAADGSGSGKTTIRPGSSVTTAVLIDGGAFGGYLQGLAVENLTLDMGAMPTRAYGFSQLHAYDVHYGKVRVANDQGKTSWNFGPGAYTTSLDDVQGSLVYCLGNGADNPTTITLINPDIGGLNVEQCANVTTIGGAIQPSYTGANTVAYLPPGVSPKGFGTNAAGMYLALGSYLLNAQFFSSIGTDWEALSQPPSTCAVAGWSYGTFNDGVHGCHPIVIGVQIGGGVSNVNFTTPTFAGLYLYNLGGSGDNLSLTGFLTGSLIGNYHDGREIYGSSFILNNSQALSGFSDDQVTRTILIDASTGGAAFSGGITGNSLTSQGPVSGRTISIQPSTSGTNFAFIGQFGCYAGTVPSTSSCFMGSGSKLGRGLISAEP